MTAQERKMPEKFLQTHWQDVLPGGSKSRKAVAVYNMDRVHRVAKGSGVRAADVVELLQKFAMMRQMMLSVGKEMGLLGKIPGVRNIAKMRQLANMDPSALFGGEGATAPALRMGPIPRTNTDRARDKRKRKAARDARKKNKRKK